MFLLVFIFIMIIYLLTTISINNEAKNVSYIKKSGSMLFIKKPFTDEAKQESEKLLNLNVSIDIQKDK